ncbi:MAG: hypothetical protein LUQ13_02215 [Methanomicrobiales archaeon]|nr:hypothetical protein [Methanomicrobiales archaeon]
MRTVRPPATILFGVVALLLIIAFCGASGCTTTQDERGRITVSVRDTSVLPKAGPSATQFIIYTYVTRLQISNTEDSPKYDVIITVHGTSSAGGSGSACSNVEDKITIPTLRALETTSAPVTFDRDTNTCSYSYTFDITSTLKG